MSLLMAIVTATVFAIFGFPYRNYLCWFSFSKLGTAVGSVLYLLVAGGGGGALGWGVATLTKVDPTSDPVLNGVLYGIGGALALRADFGARPKPDNAPDQVAQARSILTASITWAAGMLDENTARKAEAWLAAMPDDRLAAEAERVNSDIRQQPGHIVSDKAKKEMARMLVPAMEQLSEAAHRVAARAHLIAFCTRYYTERHLPKNPSATRRTRARVRQPQAGHST